MPAKGSNGGKGTEGGGGGNKKFKLPPYFGFASMYNHVAVKFRGQLYLSLSFELVKKINSRNNPTTRNLPYCGPGS